MKKIFTLFAALAMVMSMSAKVVYLKVNDNWASAEANYHVHVWGGKSDNTSIQMEKVAGETNMYQIEVGTHTHIIFLRHNPSFVVTEANKWESADDGSKLWNRIGNLVIPSDLNCFTINDGVWTEEKEDDASAYGTWSTYTYQAPVYKDVTVTVTIPSALNGNTPKIYWWGADGVADAVWGEAPEMEASPWSTMKFSYTFEQIDSVRGINYLIICDGVQTKDLYTQKDATVWFASNMPTVKVMGIAGDWTEGMETSVSSDCKSAKVMVQLPENTTNQFKLTIDGAWKGNATITADNNVATLTDGGSNATIESTKAGGYVFSYSYVTRELTVIYPGEYTLDLGELAPYYGDEGVSLSDDNYNSVEIFNLQDEEYKYGNDFDVKASIKHNGEWLDLTGKASWTLADGVMTLVATNMVDEDNSVNYTITATALAPVEKTVTCNGQYEIIDYGYCIDSTFVGVTEDEEEISITISTYSPEENEVLGSIGETFFEEIISYSVTQGEDEVLILAVVAKDGAGNTYNITITATKLVYPSVNIYGATATLNEEEGALTLSGEYEGQTINCEIWGYIGAGDYEYVGILAADYSFEWGADIATVTEDGDQYTITGVFMDYFTEEKYEVMITTAKNPATALENVTSTVAPVKAIVNGQLVIVKDGVQYNAQGAVVK